MNLISDAQLAEQFGISVVKLHELRKRHHWPHVKLGRFEFRFTPAHVEQIVAQHTQTPTVPAAKPGTAPTSIVSGQTKRSASRARAG